MNDDLTEAQIIQLLLKWVAGPYDEFGVCMGCQKSWHEQPHHTLTCEWLLVEEIKKKRG